MAFADDQNEYASLIEFLGAALLPNGQTLSEAFTLEGVPFWEVFSPELAWRHLTTAVASTTVISNAKMLIKPSVLHVKDLARRLTDSRRNDSSCQKWPEWPTVLCMGLTPRMYRDVLEPVAQYVVGHSNCNVVVLGDVAGQITEYGHTPSRISKQSIWQHWGCDARHFERRLNCARMRLKRNLTSTNSMRDLLRELDSASATAVRKMFNLLLEGYLPQIIPQAALALHILTHHGPALVLSSDTSDARVRLYTLLAKRMGIAAIEVQFGLAGKESVEWRFFSSDYVAVWGEKSRDALLHQRVPSNKILLTGSPRHDILAEPPTEIISRQRSVLGVMDGRPIVLLASTYIDRTHDEYVRPEVLIEMKKAIFEAAKAIPKLVLVVKPHPHEDTKATRTLAGEIGNVLFVDKGSDIRELIAVSDAFVSFGSTATIDALIAGKPTICPIYPGWPFSEEFRSSGAVWTPETGHEIQCLFSRIAEGNTLIEDEEKKSARVRYLDQIVCRLDNLSASRVGEIVIRTVGQKEAYSKIS